MLVLSRKLGEKIYISDNICITVVDIDRGKIRLGTEAPRDVPIFRQELLGDKKNPPPPPEKPALAAKDWAARNNRTPKLTHLRGLFCWGAEPRKGPVAAAGN